MTPRCPHCGGPVSPHRDRNEAILDVWAAGTSIAEMARAFDVSRDTVIGVVGRARKRGDPRAVKRQVGPKPRRS